MSSLFYCLSKRHDIIIRGFYKVKSVNRFVLRARVKYRQAKTVIVVNVYWCVTACVQ